MGKNIFFNFILILLLIAGGVFGGYFAFQKIFNNKWYTGEFEWGINMRPSALGRFHPSTWQKQIDVAKKLGTKWARIGYDQNSGFEVNDSIVDKLIKNGFDITMIIEQTPGKNVTDPYQEGYDDGVKIAGHYKGKIKNYQLANEGGAATIKSPTGGGQHEDEYDRQKYEPLKNYISGLSAGIKKADPKAKRIVSISFTHTGYLDMLAKDKVNYDMVGIDWYAWMGNFGSKKLDDGTLLVDKLKSFKKPLVFMEVNAVPSAPKGSQKRTIVNEGEQAAVISETAKWAWDNRSFVKGFYVLELVDNVNNPRDLEYFGIVAASKNDSGVGIPGEPRAAFYEFQKIIQQAK